jgi:hypothetical protein
VIGPEELFSELRDHLPVIICERGLPICRSPPGAPAVLPPVPFSRFLHRGAVH